MRRLILGTLGALLSLVILGFLDLYCSFPSAAADVPLPKIRHVFVIMLENEDFGYTFDKSSPATYLNKLKTQGAWLKAYYGVGHHSLDNYIAMISGQGPNYVTQEDCQRYIDFKQTALAPLQQAIGSGCVYPKSVTTLVDQFTHASLTWKAYMEDMGKDSARERQTCGQPIYHGLSPSDTPEPTQIAESSDQYAARHNPFVYFHSVIDSGDCDANVSNLPPELPKSDTNFVFIVPNLCNDGHDGGPKQPPCKNGDPGGLTSANKFLLKWVPQILASPEYKRDGLLIVTFDESDSDDVTACCGLQMVSKNILGHKVFNDADAGPGITGNGGGLVGAVLVSPFIKQDTQSAVPYNHYSLLRTIEDIFGLPLLGYAKDSRIKSFGLDVFTNLPSTSEK